MQETIIQLRDLQAIDSRLDDIIELRGDLPKRIEEIQEEIDIVAEKHGKFDARFKELNSELHILEEEINHNKVELEHDEENFKNVTNNKEYDALTHQIKARKDKIDDNKALIDDLTEKRDKIEIHVNKFANDLKELNEKKIVFEKDLNEKITETEIEEKALLKQRADIEKKIDEDLSRMYNTIRTSKKLAVSIMVKNSCVGCRSIIPLQQQAEIRNRKKIIVCESCGRILIDELED